MGQRGVSLSVILHTKVRETQVTYTLFAAAALASTLMGPVAFAEDDLGKVLDDIPEIPNAQKEEPEDAAPAPVEEASLPAYIKSVRTAVIEEWQPKAKLIKKNPKARTQFLIKLDAQGQMTNVSAIDLSGVKAFDQSVLDAIANATYPAPPPHILTEVERGVVVKLGARAYKK